MGAVRSFICPCEEDTLALGKRLGALLFSGAFIALCGDLGAGKTALVRGVGEALRTDAIASPTFTIVQEHNTNPPLLHFDAYRLSGADELEAIGFSEYLTRNGIILLEWANLVTEALPAERLDVTIHVQMDLERKLTFTAYGSAYERLVTAL